MSRHRWLAVLFAAALSLPATASRAATADGGAARDDESEAVERGGGSRVVRSSSVGPDTVVPAAFFGCIFLSIVAGFFFAARTERVRHETMRLLVEKGQPIPTELLAPKPPRRAGSDVRRGLFLVGTGLGAAIFLKMLEPQKPIWGAGLIPVLMGAALLLTAWLGGELRLRPRP
jgi:hypothetical protein